ncbi:short chain enoyl-CoA hydratase /3-hydroxyacyl-CoA dehydrogenase [Aliiruegeria haliotis]|uniref:Short chain enoyl-CoA hydratase /3-hydroxyacyl-CoA dehydrogenase n=1 Tax=Aliiruegeria haliotis TaxID=1280846 RepID=A0A2T0RK74_9RHOB|nr:enoyl-CoA hydratase/isomerase family protein [Aliiruegeria haliotis]PRY21558.1 short chain enoyl-CoA hydratase /3-hydroxyacyl-CoA dehydrogenase [Aliiruegeria haliotis]
MAQQVQVEHIGPVAVLVFSAPPGNALSAGLCADILQSMTAALRTGCKALVLLSGGTDFCADSPAHDDTEGAPDLAALCGAIENAPVPVIVGVQGRAFGDGLDLVLACHFRLATEDARFAFPDLAAARLPRGGATQRLPRLLGAEGALKVLLSADPLTAEATAGLGMIDGVARGDLVEAAVSLAQKLVARKVPARPASREARFLEDRKTYTAAVDAARRNLSGEDVAAARVLECVEAALVLPFEMGMAFEQAAGRDLADSDVAAALRYVAAAERDLDAEGAEDLPEASGARSIGFFCTGDTGADLASRLLRAGHSVTLAEAEDTRLRDGLSRIGQGLATAVEAGHLTAEERLACLELLKSGTAAAAISECDVAIVGEHRAGRPPLRASVRRLATIVLAEDDLIGPTEFRSVGGDLVLVLEGNATESLFAEIRVAASTLPSATDLTRALIRDIGGRAVVSRGRGVLATLRARLSDAADHLLEEGASPSDVDAALLAAGFAEGHYRARDRRGLGHVVRLWQHDSARRDPRDRCVPLAPQIFAEGRLGRETGQGYFDYPTGIPEGVPSAEVERLLNKVRAEAGVYPRAVTAEEIQRRCLLSLSLGALFLLAEGSVRRPEDIDLALVHGLGFARHRGGVCFMADRRGRDALLREIAGMQAQDRRFWAVPEGGAEGIKSGRAAGAG